AELRWRNGLNRSSDNTSEDPPVDIEGDPGPAKGNDGDLLLMIRVAPHPAFTRRGNRLDVVAPITLAEAVAGAKIDVPTPHGEVTVTVPPGASSGQRLRVREHGVRPKSGTAGDLFVELQIVLPTDLSESERDKIVQIVGERPIDPRADLRW
ncbi:MAG: DnaJ C-terminal domain-containing protein, partial [Planctomycetota bacterium]